MKKVVASLLCCAALLCAGVPVYAAEGDPAPETTITEGVPTEGAEAVTVQMPPATIPVVDIQPVQVRMEMVGDTPYITKTYEVDRSAALSFMVSGFEQDGFIFTRHDVYEQVQPDVVDSRLTSQTVTIPVEENSAAAVLAAAAPFIDHIENGYTGQLAIDPASIVIDEAGRSSYTYRVTDVREYDALDRNDASYIPKEVTMNGITLTLESVEWVVTGTTPALGGLVPNRFKAIATYAGSATGSEVDGYAATFTYTGTVEKVTPGKCLYSVVFRGEPVEVETNWPLYALGGALVVCFGGLGVVGFVISLRDHMALRGKKEETEDSAND